MTKYELVPCGCDLDQEGKKIPFLPSCASVRIPDLIYGPLSRETGELIVESVNGYAVERKARQMLQVLVEDMFGLIPEDKQQPFIDRRKAIGDVLRGD